jgi:hypothetical protein
MNSSVAIVVTGGEQVVPHPGDLSGVIGLVVALLDQHRETAGDQALEQLDIAAGAGHHAQTGVVGDEIGHLIRHDVLIQFAALDEIQIGVADPGLTTAATSSRSPGQPQNLSAMVRLAGPQ